MIYLAGACIAVLAFISIAQSYWGQRDHEAVAKEREQWAQERRELLNRIQAPEAAPWMGDGDANVKEAAPTQHVAFDSDEEFHEAMEEAGRLNS